MFYLVENIDTTPFLAIAPAAGSEEELIKQRLVQFENITREVDGAQVTTEQPIRPLKRMPGVFSESELPTENEQGVYTKVLNEAGTAFVDVPQERQDKAARVLRKDQAVNAIAAQKKCLNETDYIILKKAEGVLTDAQMAAQYPDVLTKRANARTAINEAENTLRTLNNDTP